MDPLDEFALPDDYILKQGSSSEKKPDSKILIPERKYKSINQDLPKHDPIVLKAEEQVDDPWSQENFKGPKGVGSEESYAMKPQPRENLIKIPENPYKPKPLREDKDEFVRRSRDQRGRFRNRGSRVRHDPVIRLENEKSENTELAWPNAVIEQSAQINEEFSIKTFKVQKCLNGDKCKGCNRYHYEGEKRRDIEKHYYHAAICPRGINCQNIEKCSKAHNFFEIFYHPQIYRSTECPFTVKFKQCVLGGFCNFLHLVDEAGKESKFKCRVCKKSDMEFVRIKCGHPCCGKCAGGDKCLKCGVDAVCYKLNLSD